MKQKVVLHYQSNWLCGVFLNENLKNEHYQVQKTAISLQSFVDSLKKVLYIVRVEIHQGFKVVLLIVELTGQISPQIVKVNLVAFKSIWLLKIIFWFSILVLKKFGKKISWHVTQMGFEFLWDSLGKRIWNEDLNEV